MNSHKLKRFTEPGAVMFLVVMVIFAAASFFFEPRLAYAEAGVIVALVIYSLIRNRKRRKELQAFVESVTYNAESATNNTLIHFPLPMAVFRLADSGVVWANQPFWAMCGRTGPALDAKLTGLVPHFSSKWLMEGKNRMAELLEVAGKKYQVNGNMVRSGTTEETYEFMGITYWVDVTEYDQVRQEYQDSRPVVEVILIDNYDEMMKPINDRQRTELRGALDLAVEKWCEGRGGIFRRVDRDRYLFIFEKRYLDQITRDRFPMVEGMHSVVSPTGIHATVSIGVGLDGTGYEENFSFASLAADMALSRGGDQAVVKNKYNFEFFGGRGGEVETRTKVKSRVMANSLSRLIDDASQVFVMGHKYADLDAVGAAAGVVCIARAKGRTGRIVLEEDKNAAGTLLERLRQDEHYKDVFLSPQEAILRADEKTLLVVVDTHRPEQVEDDSLLTACANRLAVIDHHRRAATYIENPTLSLYEPNASSACELVTEVMEEIKEGFEIMKEARIYKGIALVAAGETHNRVVAAQAADELLNISGVQASAVLYPMEGGGVAVSARSIGDVNVQVLLEQLGGGGNRSAAGVQLVDVSLRDAVNRLCAAIDKYMDTE